MAEVPQFGRLTKRGGGLRWILHVSHLCYVLLTLILLLLEESLNGYL
jgi:hypothetical protein